MSSFVLNADGGIHGADEVVVVAGAVVALEALDAGPHVAAPPGVGLVCQLRVGDDTPGDGDEVRLAAGNDLLGQLQILNGRRWPPPGC